MRRPDPRIAHKRRITEYINGPYENERLRALGLRMAEMLEKHGPGGDYFPPGGYLQRLVDDERRSPVFSDGRGDGAVEQFCWYCGLEADPVVPEHMQPRSGRGSDNKSNLVSACRSCNSLKSSMNVECFRAMLQERTKIEAFVFAGEAGLCLSGGEGFLYLGFVSLEDRIRMLAASLTKKNPGPPPEPPLSWDDAPGKGLL